MSERAERWLMVTACVVLYAVAMGVLAFAIQAPVKATVDYLLATVGPWGTAAAIAVPPIAMVGIGLWTGRNLPPVHYTPPKWPRWVRIVGNTYLALLGARLLTVFVMMVLGG